MRDLDRLIDGALADYAGEPSAGLAERVLAGRLGGPGWSPRLRAVLAGVAAAGLILVLWPSRSGGRVELEPPPLVASAIAVPALERPAVDVAVARPVLVARPLPLTRAERQLVAFAAAYPELAVAVLVEGPRRMAEPIEIAPLAIEPLAAPE